MCTAVNCEDRRLHPSYVNALIKVLWTMVDGPWSIVH